MHEDVDSHFMKVHQACRRYISLQCCHKHTCTAIDILPIIIAQKLLASRQYYAQLAMQPHT
eukprot:332640-Pelagomonas_calceolata.AAC.2